MSLVVIGLDGADWRIIDPLLAEGCLPNLKKMVDGGSRARLRSTIPHLTAPSWTSIFTGVNPGKHGIFDFEIQDGQDSGAFRAITTNDVRVPYVWEVFKEKALAFNIPCFYPPKGKDSDMLVSGFATPSVKSQFTSPADLKEELLSLAPDYSLGFSPKMLLLDKHAVSDKDGVDDFIIRDTEIKKKAAMHLMETKKWDVAFVVFSSTDHAQHYYLSDFYAAEDKASTVVGRVYRSIDEFLGYVIGKGHAAIIVSDHGFRTFDRYFFVNTYLMRKGMLALKQEHVIKRVLKKAGLSREFFMRVVPRQVFKFVWESKSISDAGRFFTPTAVANTDNIDHSRTAAYLINNNGGMRVYSRKDEVIRLLDGCRDENGKPFIKRIVDGSEAYSGDSMEGSPELLLLPNDDFFLRSEMPDVISRKMDPMKLKNGCHDEFGVFLSYGSDLMKLGKMDDVSVMDISPTILSYLGYAVPDYMDGKCLPVTGTKTKSRGKGAAQVSLRQATRLSIRKRFGRS